MAKQTIEQLVLYDLRVKQNSRYINIVQSGRGEGAPINHNIDRIEIDAQGAAALAPMLLELAQRHETITDGIADKVWSMVLMSDGIADRVWREMGGPRAVAQAIKLLDSARELAEDVQQFGPGDLGRERGSVSGAIQDVIDLLRPFGETEA